MFTSRSSEEKKQEVAKAKSNTTFLHGGNTCHALKRLHRPYRYGYRADQVLPHPHPQLSHKTCTISERLLSRCCGVVQTHYKSLPILTGVFVTQEVAPRHAVEAGEGVCVWWCGDSVVVECFMASISAPTPIFDLYLP